METWLLGMVVSSRRLLAPRAFLLKVREAGDDTAYCGPTEEGWTDRGVFAGCGNGLVLRTAGHQSSPTGGVGAAEPGATATTPSAAGATAPSADRPEVLWDGNCAGRDAESVSVAWGGCVSGVGWRYCAATV